MPKYQPTDHALITNANMYPFAIEIWCLTASPNKKYCHHLLWYNFIWHI